MAKRKKSSAYAFKGVTNRTLEKRIQSMLATRTRWKDLKGRTFSENYSYVTRKYKIPSTLGISRYDFSPTKEGAKAYRQTLIRQIKMMTGQYQYEYAVEARNSLARALKTMNAPDKFVRWVSRNLSNEDLEEYDENFGYIKTLLYGYQDSLKGVEEEYGEIVAGVLAKREGANTDAERDELFEKWGF